MCIYTRKREEKQTKITKIFVQIVVKKNNYCIQNNYIIHVKHFEYYVML